MAPNYRSVIAGRDASSSTNQRSDWPECAVGSGRSITGISCRCPARRQSATISSASLQSIRSTDTDCPKISVAKGQARCCCSIQSKPARRSVSAYASTMASSTRGLQPPLVEASTGGHCRLMVTRRLAGGMMPTSLVSDPAVLKPV